MKLSRVVEYVFFFGLLLLAGYMVWQIISPFITALAISAVIVTICHPLYLWIKKIAPKQNKTIASLLATLIVLIAIVLPIVFISSLVVQEVVSFYKELDSGEASIQSQIYSIESAVNLVIPGFNIDLQNQLRAVAEWLSGNLGAIFAGTVSTIFIFFISMVGSFFLFRDGNDLLKFFVKISPLPDSDDKVILNRLAKAVRAVVTGTVFVALIQGSLVALGFTIFGIERAILWGSLASLGALVPGIGTTIVTLPAIGYLFFTGEMFSAVGLLVWSVLIVGLIDNFIGPYLMSRGNNLHPFVILLSVLGGISLMGPVGFIIGPVIVTFFIVLLEIYNQYIIKEEVKEELVSLNDTQI